eukprot:scaffold6827_cov55-Phaeocystis_antarctica.AAC.2
MIMLQTPKRQGGRRGRSPEVLVWSATFGAPVEAGVRSDARSLSPRRVRAPYILRSTRCCGSQIRSSNTRADLLSRAVSRTPARAIASRGEGRGARPRATNEQLVGIGQGGGVLPMVESRAYDAGRGIRAGRRRAAGDGS